MAPPANQAFFEWVSLSTPEDVSAPALLAVRFSLIDMPDFFDMAFRGDLSAIFTPSSGKPYRLRFPRPYAMRIHRGLFPWEPSAAPDRPAPPRELPFWRRAVVTCASR